MYLFAILSVLLLAGCVGSSIRYSNVLAKPEEKFKGFNVIYLENDLIAKNHNTASIVSIGYNDLPELMRERVPIIMQEYDLVGECESVKKVYFSDEIKAKAVKWSKANPANLPLLIIQVTGGTALRYQASTAFYLDTQASLFNANQFSRIWTAQLSTNLGISPLVRDGFDNKYVDQLLRTIFKQMKDDGLLLAK